MYLPETRWEPTPRRTTAQLPAYVVFQTKPEQGIAMLEHAWAKGVPMRWVTGDEVYGDDPRLRETVERQRCGYVLAVSSTTPAWTERPPVGEPVRTTGGGARTQG